MAVKAAFIGRIASSMKCFGGYIAVVLTLLLNGCVDYSDTTQAVSTTIKLTVPTALTGTMALNGHTITLTNADGVKLTATTNVQGEATFANLVPDVYTVSAAWNLSFAEYSQATGDTQVNEGAVVSATLNNQLIDQSTTITLPTTLAIKRSLVISKVFYAGNKDRNNRNSTAAQYIELYNQSDQPVDVAGLYIGLLETGSTPAYTLSNLRLGGALMVPIDEYNRFSVAVDANKLLVPTRPIQRDNELPADFDKRLQRDYYDVSSINGIFKSFSDAPGGLKEELQEVAWSLGGEYVYHDQFAVRAGYHHESANKGNRKYLTLGAGCKTHGITLNAAYLIATAKSNPLDQTLRLSLAFDFDGIKDLFRR